MACAEGKVHHTDAERLVLEAEHHVVGKVVEGEGRLRVGRSDAG